MRNFVLSLCVALLAGGTASADDPLEAAKAHFRAGETLYAAGQYSDAVREFGAGYQLAPRPLFLLNLGQAYRKLGDLPRALDDFEKYLNATPESDPRRAEVQQMADELRATLAAEPPSPSPSPRPSVEPAAAVAAPAPVVVLSSALDATAPAPPPKKSFVRRHWWIFPVAAVVVGAAVGLGVYFGTQSVNRFDCSSTIACVDAAR